MRIFLTRVFARFARAERISDRALREAVARAEAGLVDADLGGGVIKQRVARPGSGKSGGYRTIILFRKGDKAFFVHGYAKKDLANVGPTELKAFKEAARTLLLLSEQEIATSIINKEFEELDGDGEN